MGAIVEAAILRRSECVSPAGVRMPMSPDFGAIGGAMVHHERWRETDSAHRYQHTHGGAVVTVDYRQDETPADLWDRLISQQDVNSIYILAYCLTGLMPTVPITPGASLSARFDLTEVARRCGLLTRSGTVERLRAVERVYRALEAGERYVVSTTRTYHVKRKAIERPVSAALWRINDVAGWGPGEIPADLPMMDAAGCPYVLPPSSARLTLSETLAECLGTTELMQHLSGIENLAAIPAGQTWGKIARALGLRVLFVARLGASRGDAAADITAFLKGEEPERLPALTRREWITASGGPNPDEEPQNHRDRYRKAYYKACAELATDGPSGLFVLAKYGDAAPGAFDASASTRWDAWLSERVRFVPGSTFWPQLRELARRSGFVAADSIVRNVLHGRGRPAKAPQVRKGGPGFLPAYPDLRA